MRANEYYISYPRWYSRILIIINIFLQVTVFSLMKLSWIRANHTLLHLLNSITFLALSITLIRALTWQYILRMNSLSSSYLPNAIVPSLLVLAGYFFFNETLTKYNLLGTIIVLIGLLLLYKRSQK